jgi:hypothetical protein
MDQDEISRVREGAKESLPAGKILANFIASCNGDAPRVLDRCKQVLRVVLQASAEDWPSTDAWRSKLPEWFVEVCSEEISQAEAERRLRLSMKERISLSQRWTVSAFVHWFQPGERYWYWWDAEVKDTNTIHIKVIAQDEPFPWGSLDWLLRAAGSLSVEER